MNRRGWLAACCLAPVLGSLLVAWAPAEEPSDNHSHVVTEALHTDRDRARELMKDKLAPLRATSNLMSLANRALQDPQAKANFARDYNLNPEDLRKLEKNVDIDNPAIRDFLDQIIKHPPANVQELLKKYSEKDREGMQRRLDESRSRNVTPPRIDPTVPVDPQKRVDPQPQPKPEDPKTNPPPARLPESKPPPPPGQPEPPKTQSSSSANPVAEWFNHWINSESAEEDSWGGKLPGWTSFGNVDGSFWSKWGIDSSGEGAMSSLTDVGKLFLRDDVSPPANSGGDTANEVPSPTGGIGYGWLVALVVGVLVVIGVVAWRWRAVRGQLAEQGQAGWRLGPWPVQPGAVCTRQQLIQAFEYLSLLCLGRPARAYNHHQIAERLGQQTAAEGRRAAEHLAELYEHARYAPPDEPLPENDLSGARRDLTLLAGGVGA